MIRLLTFRGLGSAVGKCASFTRDASGIKLTKNVEPVSSFTRDASGICKLTKNVEPVSRNHCFLSISNRLVPSSNNFVVQDPISFEIQCFKESFEVIHDSLTRKNSNIPTEVSKRLENVLQYNVLGGKHLRAYIVITTFKELKSSLPTTEEILEDLKLARILGWCVELLQGFFIVSDDIMDNGLMRRGKDCWFRLPNVGLQGVNDGLLLETCIYDLLKRHFSDKECYQKLVDEFLTRTRATVWGQSLDMASNPSGQKPELELFKLKRYWEIVNLKTTQYTFCLPMFLSMHLIGNFSPEEFKVVENMCIKFGRLFQLQDDFLDLYGKQSEIGKIGTDILEGKCTWFAATALEQAKSSERKIIEENYGVKDPSATEKIMQLYDTMSLKEKFAVTQNQLQSEIASLIGELDDKKQNAFFNVWNFLYERSK